MARKMGWAKNGTRGVHAGAAWRSRRGCRRFWDEPRGKCGGDGARAWRSGFFGEERFDFAADFLFGGIAVEALVHEAHLASAIEQVARRHRRRDDLLHELQ